MVINMIEAALDIALDDPLIGCPTASAVFSLRHRSHGHAHMLQSAVAASSGSKPIGDMPELRFKDRLQKILDRILYDTISDSGNAEGSELPRLARLRD
jgi:hypothetical protein